MKMYSLEQIVRFCAENKLTDSSREMILSQSAYIQNRVLQMGHMHNIKDSADKLLEHRIFRMILVSSPVAQR